MFEPFVQVLEQLDFKTSVKPHPKQIAFSWH